jgi:hypothetical protein
VRLSGTRKELCLRCPAFALDSDAVKAGGYPDFSIRRWFHHAPIDAESSRCRALGVENDESLF